MTKLDRLHAKRDHFAKQNLEWANCAERYRARVGELERVLREYLKQHHICNSDDESAQCPCATCDIARAALDSGNTGTAQEREPDVFDWMGNKMAVAMVEAAQTLEGMNQPFRAAGLATLDELWVRPTGKHFNWNELKKGVMLAKPATCPRCGSDRTNLIDQSKGCNYGSFDPWHTAKPAACPLCTSPNKKLRFCPYRAEGGSHIDHEGDCPTCPHEWHTSSGVDK